MLASALTEVGSKSSPPYRSLALLAPDIAVADFRPSALPVKRVSVYFNSKDAALRASAFKHHQRRLGRSPVPSPEYESIDITAATAKRPWPRRSDHLSSTALYDLLWNVVRAMPATCRAHRGLGTESNGVWTLRVTDAGYELKDLPEVCRLPFSP